MFIKGRVTTLGGVGRILVLLAVSMMLSACQDCGPFPTLPHLELPHVRLVGNNAGGYAQERIWVKTVSPTPGSAPVLYALAMGRDRISAVNLVSGDKQTISLRQSCLGIPELSSDGAWLACDGPAGIAVASFSITPQLTPRVLVPLVTNRLNIGVAWAPDGQHLAVLVGTTFSIYSTVPPYTSAQLLAQLNMSSLVGACDLPQHACSLFDPAWSPDDNWLTFIQDTTGIVKPIFAIHVAGLPQSVLAPRAKPIALDVAPSEITFVANTEQLTPPAWIPHTSALTYLSQDGRRIDARAMPSGVPVTLLSQQKLDLGTLAWSQDARLLVFSATGLAVGPIVPEMTTTPASPAGDLSAGRPFAISQVRLTPADCANALPDLYVYTPPAD